MRAIRAISSARASTSTLTHSLGILRSKSCSCSTLTSPASINNRLRKVMVHGVQQWSDQRRETQKGFLAHMRLLGDLYVRRIRRQHPYRNLQTLSGGFLNTDCAVSAFGFADNLKGEAVEWVEWIKNTNLLGFCTQGIVRVVTFILTSTASCRPVDSPPDARVGYQGPLDSSYLKKCSRESSVASS